MLSALDGEAAVPRELIGPKDICIRRDQAEEMMRKTDF